jgi:hypothetical protein
MTDWHAIAQLRSEIGFHAKARRREGIERVRAETQRRGRNPIGLLVASAILSVVHHPDQTQGKKWPVETALILLQSERILTPLATGRGSPCRTRRR